MVSLNSERMFQCNPSGSSTVVFAKRCASSSSRVEAPTRPTITRPLSAPRSTAANALPVLVKVEDLLELDERLIGRRLDLE